MKNNKSGGILRHWKSTKTKVEQLLQFQYNCQDIDLVDIRYSFADKFYDYTTLDVDDPLSEVTQRKGCRTIRGGRSATYLSYGIQSSKIN